MQVGDRQKNADVLGHLDGDILDVDEVYGRGHGYGGRPKPPAGLGLRYVFAVRLVDRRIARRGDRQTGWPWSSHPRGWG